MLKIFVSHSSHDQAFALELVGNLKALGGEPWSYADGNSSGQSIVTELDKAMENSDVFILLLSRRAQKSEWIKWEWENWEATRLGKKKRSNIIVGRLDDTKVPMSLNRYQQIKFNTSNKYVAFIELLHLLQKVAEYIGIRFPAKLGSPVESRSSSIRVFRDRRDIELRNEFNRLFKKAHTIKAVGISLNLLCLDVGRKNVRGILCVNRHSLQVLFLNPGGQHVGKREDEEGYSRGTLSRLIKANISILKSSSSSQSRTKQLQIGLYDRPPRLNMYIFDSSSLLLQHYDHSTSGSDSPCFLIRKQADAKIFAYYEEMFSELWATALHQPRKALKP